MTMLKSSIRNPGMWGISSLNDFILFISGWNAARQELGLPDLFRGFQAWQTNRFGRPTGHAWAYSMVDIFGNDVSQIHSFITLLKEFHHETNQPHPELYSAIE